MALSIGVFDGVHRGHQVLLSQLMIDAAKSGLTPAVATFDPHPLEVLAPQRAPKMLTSIEHRLQILEELGMGVVGVMPFPKIR
ncbi:MAG: bifunctional riboflavin kinase/FAD synthetase, partial [Actinomycetia bacterium]|nr:bifunctional riboflavin kinase/FAD synthetase [Actinomycetes bacterium]